MIAKDVRQFLARFETTLKVLARDGRHVELDARLGDFQKLLGAWLDVAPPGTRPPERMQLFSIADRFGGPLEIDLRDIAEAAQLSEDTSTVVTLTDHLLQAAFACQNRQQPRLMQEFFNTLIYFYYRCVRTESLPDAMGSRLDAGLHSLFMRFQLRRRDTNDRALPVEERERLFLDVALRFALALTHAAVRHEQTRYAEYFVERIFEHRKYDSRRSGVFEITPLSTGGSTTFDYLAVVLVGWSLHVLRERACSDPAAAEAVLRVAIQQLPPIAVLVGQWELLRRPEGPEGDIDGRLGISNWDIRDWDREFRVGVSEARWGGDDWIRLGLRASLLLSQSRFRGDPLQLFSSAPDRFLWDANKEREALEQLAEDEWLKIPNEERQKRVEAAMEVIDRRARGGNAEYLRYVLESPLSDDRVAKLRDEAVNAYRSRGGWQDALRSCGVGHQAFLCPLHTLGAVWVPREYLLDDNNWGSGIGEHLGQYVAMGEGVALLHLIETTSARIGELDALARLPAIIRAARRQMSDAGFDPNVLVLPQEERFAGALYRKPLWQIEGRREFGEASIGLWEGLLVLRFPYTDPESILLIDSRRALAELEPDDGESGVAVWIDENPENEEIAEKKRIAAEALRTKEGALPDSHSIQVLARMLAIPRLGIASTSASSNIGITKSDGGFALPSGSDLYHRPSCVEIEFDDVEYVLRLPPDNKRTPCPKCQPDRWNAEARRGQIKDETASDKE